MDLNNEKASVEINYRMGVDNGYGHPIASVFEGCLDFDNVKVKRNEYAVKAFTPISFVITVTGTLLLEKLILEPLINPIAEKFNWVKAVNRYLHPFEPFSLIVKIRDENYIEVNTGTCHKITADIWKILQRVINILREEELLSTISKIRIESQKSKTPLIVCYQDNKPTRIVMLKSGKTRKISKNLREKLESPPDMEGWQKSVIARAKAYAQFVSKVVKK